MNENLIYTYIFYFFVYAFLGWVIEVAYHAITCGKFINRGFLAGTVCPIYGFGSVVIIYLFEPLKDNLLLLFVGSAIFCTILEYFVGLFLDKVFHKKWWDYSDVPFNIGGYVCVQFAIYWGIGGILLIRDIHSLIEKITLFFSLKVIIIFCIIFFIVIIIDTLASIQSVLKFNKKLEILSKLQDDIYEISDFIGENVSDNTLFIAEKAGPVVDEISDKKRYISDEIENGKKAIKTNIDKYKNEKVEFISELKKEKRIKMQKLIKEREEILKKQYFGERRIIKLSPKIKEIKYAEIFDEIKERYNKK